MANCCNSTCYTSCHKRRVKYRRKLILGLFVFAVFVFSCALLYGADYGAIKATVVRVHDGDTIIVNIKNTPLLFGEEIGVRVNGVDTPELHGQCDYERALALKAKQFTEALIKPGQVITLKRVDRDKYFRILADISIGKTDLAQALIHAGLAREYHGEAKSVWCLVEQSLLDASKSAADPKLIAY